MQVVESKSASGQKLVDRRVTRALVWYFSPFPGVATNPSSISPAYDNPLPYFQIKHCLMHAGVISRTDGRKSM